MGEKPSNGFPPTEVLGKVLRKPQERKPILKIHDG